jgi:hypothetical protein
MSITVDDLRARTLLAAFVMRLDRGEAVAECTSVRVADGSLLVRAQPQVRALP